MKNLCDLKLHQTEYWNYETKEKDIEINLIYFITIHHKYYNKHTKKKKKEKLMNSIWIYFTVKQPYKYQIYSYE